MNFMKDQNLMEVKSNSTQDEISFVDYDANIFKQSKSNLLSLLDNIDQDALSAELKGKVKDVVSYIDYSPDTSSNTLVKDLESSAQLVFQEYKKTNENLAYTINDNYEDFLQKVKNSDIQLVAGDDIDMTISLPLLSTDQKTKDLLKANPVQEYLSYQE